MFGKYRHNGVCMCRLGGVGAVGRTLMRWVCSQVVMGVEFRPSYNEQEQFPKELAMRLKVMMMMLLLLLMFMLIQ